MESKFFLIFATISLLSLLLPLFSQTVFAKSSVENQSPFDFLKQLQGCRKNDMVKGISELKSYLKRFGYLSSSDPSYGLQETDDDNFDELLESAIKTYQLNYNLKVTGSLDAETISVMSESRCGVADSINGKSRMKSGKKQNHPRRSGSFHAVSRYVFFDGEPKWPPSKTQLTYALAPGTRTDASGPVAQAFSTWASVTNFTFIEVQDYNNADLQISFQTGDHGDGNPFDGPNGILAHAFTPTDGRFHYDGAENWAVGAKDNTFDLGTLALHEIGHLLGFAHTSVIMFPTIDSGKVKGLNDDDIKGIQDLYN